MVSTVRRSLTVVFAAAALVLALLAVPAAALPPGGERFPQVIALPDGFEPEGIVVAPGGTAYAGSLATGEVVAVDLRTGATEVVFGDEGDDGPAVGIEYERSSRVLLVAGGPAGTLEIIDARTGDLIERVRVLDPGAGFINDVAVSGDTVYLTDSFGASLFAVALDDPTDVRQIPLHGDFTPVGGFNLNGIVALPAGDLVAVQSATGTLFRIDPATGDATAIALTDATGSPASLPNGDGIERQGGTLYVVQNQLNQIAVVDLDGRATAGTVERLVTDPAFDVPTTVDRFGDRLYVVNARFGTAGPPPAEYDIVGTPLRVMW